MLFSILFTHAFDFFLSSCLYLLLRFLWRPGINQETDYNSTYPALIPSSQDPTQSSGSGETNQTNKQNHGNVVREDEKPRTPDESRSGPGWCSCLSSPEKMSRLLCDHGRVVEVLGCIVDLNSQIAGFLVGWGTGALTDVTFVECSAGPDKMEKLWNIFMWGNSSYE